MQITGAILLLGSGYFAYKFAENIKQGTGIWALTLTLFYMPLIYWSLVGMEVSALVFITFLALYLYVKDKTTLIPFLMALGVLIRMVLRILLSVFFMLLYYGDILPNTYYLKATGLDIYTYLRGIFYTVFKNRDKLSKVFLFAFIVLVLYVVKVGGDVWESSFIFLCTLGNRGEIKINPFTLIPYGFASE